MRWVLVAFESVALGALSVVALVTLFFTCLSVYLRRVSGPAIAGAVGWDLVSLFASLFGQHWQVTITAILVGTFLSGGSLAFWFFSQRVHL